MSDAALMMLVRTVVTADDTVAFRLLAANPALAKASFEIGATPPDRRDLLPRRDRALHIRGGDTALHVAAAAYRQEIVQKLIATGANVRARNRRGAEPFTTPSMACRAHADGTRPHKRRRPPSQEQERLDPEMLLATQNTGRGGSGSSAAKAQQELIVQLLREHINGQI